MSHLVFHPIYSQLDLPVRHRFPIQKYQGIKDALLREKVPAECFYEPRALAIEALSRIYDPVYIGQLCSGELDWFSMVKATCRTHLNRGRRHRVNFNIGA
mgnify:CR=1 FL=1